MKVYFGKTLLQENDVLGVEEANPEYILFEGIYPDAWSSFRVSIKTNENDKEYILNNKLTHENNKTEKLFLSPGNYRLTIFVRRMWSKEKITDSYAFTVKPSGEVYSRFPKLASLHTDLLTLIAYSLPIAQICDLERPDKKILSPYFFRELAKERLTENPEYLKSPIPDILNDLHFLDLHPITNLEKIEYWDHQTELFWLKFDKVKQKYLSLPNFLCRVEYYLDYLFTNFDSYADEDEGIESVLDVVNEYLGALFPGIRPIPWDVQSRQISQTRTRIYHDIFTKIKHE